MLKNIGHICIGNAEEYQIITIQTMNTIRVIELCLTYFKPRDSTEEMSIDRFAYGWIEIEKQRRLIRQTQGQFGCFEIPRNTIEEFLDNKTRMRKRIHKTEDTKESKKRFTGTSTEEL